MLSNWLTFMWMYVTSYARWNDAFVLFLAGLSSAALTLPADGQNWRVWVFSTATIVLNIAYNAIRRTKSTADSF